MPFCQISASCLLTYKCCYSLSHATIRFYLGISSDKKFIHSPWCCKLRCRRTADSRTALVADLKLVFAICASNRCIIFALQASKILRQFYVFLTQNRNAYSLHLHHWFSLCIFTTVFPFKAATRHLKMSM